MDNGYIYKLNEEIIFNGEKRILIDTESKFNYIEMARKNNEIHAKYKELLKNDYIFIKVQYQNFIKEHMLRNYFRGKI
ncbi:MULTISPECIES: hypothetical protein [Staphylococcus]|uniref:hypothetical protein n=1 Tax=Staphylococcus TaxID=1279 RepID=UPI001FDA934A|nr:MULTISPECIES: hypothetical protein [Staphylococcus]